MCPSKITRACSPVVPRPQTVASELVEVGGGATTMMRSPPPWSGQALGTWDVSVGTLLFKFVDWIWMRTWELSGIMGRMRFSKVISLGYCMVNISHGCWMGWTWIYPPLSSTVAGKLITLRLISRAFLSFFWSFLLSSCSICVQANTKPSSNQIRICPLSSIKLRRTLINNDQEKWRHQQSKQQFFSPMNDWNRYEYGAPAHLGYTKPIRNRKES